MRKRNRGEAVLVTIEISPALRSALRIVAARSGKSMRRIWVESLLSSNRAVYDEYKRRLAEDRAKEV